MSNRRYEQGGVVSFFVVATVLALLFAGALLWAKNQGRTTQVAEKPTSLQATQDSSSASNTTTSTNGSSQSNSAQQKAPDSSSKSTSNTGSTPSTTNSGQSSTTTPSSSTNTGTTANDTSKPSTTPSSNAAGNSVASTGPSVDQIPSAGPMEVVATVIAMSAVSATLYVLVQSQKRVRSSALK